MNYQTIFGPSIMPFVTHRPNQTQLYASYGSGVLSLNTKVGDITIVAGNGIQVDTSGQVITVKTLPGTYGTASSIVWGAVATFYFGSISVPGLTDNGIVQVTVQSVDASDLGATGPPIIFAATPLTNAGSGVIAVYISKLPLSNANFKVAYQVLKF
jgi:hypothetical protein